MIIKHQSIMSLSITDTDMTQIPYFSKKGLYDVIFLDQCFQLRLSGIIHECHLVDLGASSLFREKIRFWSACCIIRTREVRGHRMSWKRKKNVIFINYLLHFYDILWLFMKFLWHSMTFFMKLKNWKWPTILWLLWHTWLSSIYEVLQDVLTFYDFF